MCIDKPEYGEATGQQKQCQIFIGAAVDLTVPDKQAPESCQDCHGVHRCLKSACQTAQQTVQPHSLAPAVELHTGTQKCPPTLRMPLFRAAAKPTAAVKAQGL